MKNQRLEKIEKTFTMIDDGFDNAYAKADTDEAKESLKSARDAARDAFWDAAAANLEKNSPFLDKLSSDLDTANNDLEQSLANLADVSVAINAMEEAIRLAAALAALAAI